MRITNTTIKESYELTVEELKETLGISRNKKIENISFTPRNKSGQEGRINIRTIEGILTKLRCHNCDWDKVVLGGVGSPDRCPGCRGEDTLYAENFKEEELK